MQNNHKNLTKHWLILVCKRLLVLFIIVNTLCSSACAQDKWNLKDCLDFYKNNNLRVQQQSFVREKARLQLKASKRSFLPVVDGRWRSASNWGFLIDPSTNILARRFNLGNQASLNASWDLFNGPSADPIVKLRAQELAVAEYEYKAVVSTISLDITFLYLQALLTNEQVNDARQKTGQLEIKRKQIEKQVAEGVLHKRDVLSIQSQIAYQALQTVNAENNLDKARFNLMQTMGLQQNKLIDIEPIEVPDSLLVADPDAEIIQPTSEEAFAEVQAARAQAEAAVAKINVMRYSKLPVLSIGGQVATRTSNFQKAEFGTQLRNNFNQQAGINLVVPIFNSNLYQNNIALAKLEMQAAQASYRQAKDDIRQRIFAALLDYKAAYRKFVASQVGYKALVEENRFAEKQLRLGVISVVEYGEVQSRLSTAKSELLGSKYDCYFKLKALNYYKDQSQFL